MDHPGKAGTRKAREDIVIIGAGIFVPCFLLFAVQVPFLPQTQRDCPRTNEPPRRENPYSQKRGRVYRCRCPQVFPAIINAYGA